MTINRLQNLFLKIIGVNSQIFTFTYSQFYIALLQITSAQRVRVFLFENGNKKTNNIVYPEVLFQLSQA